MNNLETLEFNKILQLLSERAVSENVRTRCLLLNPASSIKEAERLINETTQARKIIEQTGSPPIAVMTDLKKALTICEADALLTPEQIERVSSFLMSCRRMKDYLKRAEATGEEAAFYGGSIVELKEVEAELNRCIRSGEVDDKASQRLYELRWSINIMGEQIQGKLTSMLKKNKEIFSEGFVAVRNGRYTLPVKKEYKNRIEGVLVEISNTGGTCFIEPAQVRKLQEERSEMMIAEDCEVRRILYELGALIYDNLSSIRINIEAMETLDFLFAKGKLSIDMNANPVSFTKEREFTAINARHPLISKETVVPLSLTMGNGVWGIIITGPNTGGKTVALKTFGLLSVMAQSGLHVPADTNSCFCIFDMILCDIGDGQSISENLSTFSAHMTNILNILRTASSDSLILLDELGSGTDPAEGMGIAVSVLEELRLINCLFAATTHYPEIKEYAEHTPGLVNARMAFDRKSLMPLYQLEIGEAGESCALYIAERLGMPEHMLKRAYNITYSREKRYKSGEAAHETIHTDLNGELTNLGSKTELVSTNINESASAPKNDKPKIPHSQRFSVGDSVTVYPKKEIGIVYTRANEKGEVGVQIKGKKLLVNHKRLKLKTAAEKLYPDNYDLSIVFDSVETRKARHKMDKGHVEGNIIIIKEGTDKK